MSNTENFANQYRLKAFIVFGVALLLLVYRLLGHGLLYSMKAPLFLFEQKELIYRIFLGSGIPEFLTSLAPVALLFDVLLFTMAILLIVKPHRLYAVAFTVLLLAYFFTYNLVTGHHYHGLVGAIIISIPFWTNNETRFNLLWQSARYYFLYIFASAALWKIFRGSVFYTDQLSNILKSQQLDLLLQKPESFHTHIIQYLIANPAVSHWVLVANVLVQLCFFVGFFTRRFDLLLLVLAIVFCTANYFVMSIVSAELLILGLTLLDWDWLLINLPGVKLLNKNIPPA